MSRRQELFQILSNAFAELATLPDEVTSPDKPPLPSLVPQRLTRWAAPFGLTVKKLAERPDAPLRNAVYAFFLKDLFTTRAGSWELGSEPGSVEAWARDTYLRVPADPLYIDEGGGDHHLFGMVLGLDGLPLKRQSFVFWSDGLDKLADKTYKGYQMQLSAPKSGWANLAMAGSSGYYPERDGSGPWCYAPMGAAEVVCGAGMPNHEHISTFAVWQLVKL